MSVTELMVSLCIVAIVAAVAIPSYINYVQQARVVSLVIPRLHLLETNISHFYSINHRLPGSSDLEKILSDIDVEHLDISLNNGSVVLAIRSAETGSKLNILNGKVLIASPVVSRDRITSWHLAGELSDRLGISY